MTTHAASRPAKKRRDDKWNSIRELARRDGKSFHKLSASERGAYINNWPGATAPAAVPRARLTSADREWYAIVKATAARGADGLTGIARSPRSKNGPSVKLPDSVWIPRARAEGCLCGCPYGGYLKVGDNYLKHSPVQMHVTKTVKEGGTKADVYPGCQISNDIHHHAPGMPVADLKALINETFRKRGYRYVIIMEVS